MNKLCILILFFFIFVFIQRNNCLDFGTNLNIKINGTEYYLGKEEIIITNGSTLHLNLEQYFKPFHQITGFDLIDCTNCSISQTEINLIELDKYSESRRILIDYAFDEEEALIYYLDNDGIKVLNLITEGSNLSFVKGETQYIYKHSMHNYKAIYLAKFQEKIKVLIIVSEKGLLFSSPLIQSKYINSFHFIEHKITFNTTMDMQIHNNILFIPSQNLGCRVYFFLKNYLIYLSTLLESNIFENHNITEILIPDQNENIIIIADTIHGLYLCNFSNNSYNFRIYIQETINIQGIISLKFTEFYGAKFILAIGEINGRHRYYELINTSKNYHYKIRRIIPLQSNAESMMVKGMYCTIVMENLLTVIKIGSEIYHQIIAIPKIYDASIFQLQNNYIILSMDYYKFELSKLVEISPILNLDINFNNSLTIKIFEKTHFCLEIVNNSMINLYYFNPGICTYILDLEVVYKKNIFLDIYIRSALYGILIISIISLIIILMILYICLQYNYLLKDYNQIKEKNPHSDRIVNSKKSNLEDTNRKINLKTLEN